MSDVEPVGARGEAGWVAATEAVGEHVRMLAARAGQRDPGAVCVAVDRRMNSPAAYLAHADRLVFNPTLFFGDGAAGAERAVFEAMLAEPAVRGTLLHELGHRHDRAALAVLHRCARWGTATLLVAMLGAAAGMVLAPTAMAWGPVGGLVLVAGFLGFLVHLSCRRWSEARADRYAAVRDADGVLACLNFLEEAQQSMSERQRESANIVHRSPAARRRRLHAVIQESTSRVGGPRRG